MTADTIPFRQGLTALDDMDLFNQICGYAIRAKGLTRAEAGERLDQAIAYLIASDRHPELALSPSDEVDDLLDSFILHTVGYVRFCQRMFGKYIHHTPFDPAAPPLAELNGRRLLTPYETAQVIRDSGYYVIDRLWPMGATPGCVGNCYTGDHVGDPPPSED